MGEQQPQRVSLVWLLIFLAAVMPFAFIGVELFLRREEQNRGSQLEPA